MKSRTSPRFHSTSFDAPATRSRALHPFALVRNTRAPAAFLRSRQIREYPRARSHIRVAQNKHAWDNRPPRCHHLFYRANIPAEQGTSLRASLHPACKALPPAALHPSSESTPAPCALHTKEETAAHLRLLREEQRER